MLRKNAPAKINLGLHVLQKRADGFHDIETVFLRIPWADVLQFQVIDQGESGDTAKRGDAASDGGDVRDADDVSDARDVQGPPPAAHGDGRGVRDLLLTCSDATLPTDERNLVVKAAALLKREHDVDRGAAIHLGKHVPYGAGLGGGSSDAATTLLALNELWELGLDRDDLAAYALQLGSDVPFFLGSETAIGRGRGERLEPLIDPDTDEPYRPAFPLVVAVPEVHVPTAEAYAAVTPRAGGRPILERLILSNDLDRWSRELTNDFEPTVFARYPEIAEVKNALLQSGAGYASMSGSGSAVFGFFEEDAVATAAAEALRTSGHRVWRGRV